MTWKHIRLNSRSDEENLVKMIYILKDINFVRFRDFLIFLGFLGIYFNKKKAKMWANVAKADVAHKPCGMY